MDEAPCIGWIDGVRRSLGGQRYCIRFPRRPGSMPGRETLVRRSTRARLIPQFRRPPAQDGRC